MSDPAGYIHIHPHTFQDRVMWWHIGRYPEDDPVAVNLPEAVRLKALEEAAELYRADTPEAVDREACDLIIVAIVAMARYGTRGHEWYPKLKARFAEIEERPARRSDRL